MTFFNEKVLATLKKHGEIVSEQEIKNYTDICQEVEQKAILGHKTTKEHSAGDYRPRSIFHAYSPELNHVPGPVYEHWLVLPGPKNWITKSDEQDEKKQEETVAKLYINLETGEEWFAKIRRRKKKKKIGQESDGKIPVLQDDPDASQRDIVRLADAFKEQTNHDRMNIESHTFTRYDKEKGTKSYSLQRYIGKRNLMDLLEDPNTGPTVLHDVLIQSGERLKEIHKLDYLHADFKPQNIVYKEEDGKIQVIDFETLMHKRIGREGIHQIRGTPNYLHPQWFQESLKSWRQQKPVYYDVQNDVFAYLVMAKLFMDKAYEREPDIILKSSWLVMIKKIENWKSKPMKDMPTLEQVLACLKGEKPKQATTMRISF